MLSPREWPWVRRLLSASIAVILLPNACLARDTSRDEATPLPSLVWMAPILAGGGYSSEAMSYVLALDEAYLRQKVTKRLGIRQFAEHENSEFVKGLPPKTSSVLGGLIQSGAQSRSWDVAVCHATPDTWHADGAFGWGRVQPCPPPRTRFSIGRTMYETNRLPKTWVKRINKMDEVWVPTKFAVEQFAASGVSREKLVAVPEAVDTDHFDPAVHEPLELPASEQDLFRFLSVFKWERRKGWDVLLRAYFEEFSAHDSVILYIKTRAFHSDSEFEAKVQDFVKSLGDVAKKPLARHAVLGDDIPLRDLPRLYRAADLFVLPSRGEGWGRPHVEAMSMELPVIATNWSGPTEFLNEECGLPLRIAGLQGGGEGIPEAHLWAEPSVPHLKQLMRWAVDHREEARQLGIQARKVMVQHYSPAVVAEQHILPHLRRIARRMHSDEL
eukprot:TRINITY_DN56617_c0_g1_i1.p1 TRINITY_DN56617_c0_g1~~TRINITY_DN56617_c0_g1_i1.p1  ORF type:complete len:466 (-),score=57.42 TRINITY_DN56617_c0_g1_i1:214-1539(-)